jgi:endonuclease YncB( thermonuclease family)
MEIEKNSYKKLLLQVQKIIKKTEENIVESVNRQKVLMSWQIGRDIDEHFKNNLKETEESIYGKKLLEQLAKDTTIKKRALYQMRSFYKAYPTLPAAENDLSWSHYRALASIQNQEAREMLEDLTLEKNLNPNELQREIAENKPQKKTKTKLTKSILTCTRGRVFTYKLLAGFEENQVVVDLGFNISAAIKTGLGEGEIVESKKSGEKYSLKKSDVKPAQMHTYFARLDRVFDGDTIRVTLDLGFGVYHQEILRLAKINAPEAKTAEGKKSSEALKKILKDVLFLIVKTNKTDIYGRYVADVFFSETGEENPQKIADGGIYLSQLLLDLGVVEEY